ncbi:MAG: hypothetical protein GC180_13380 [Bacteroidetes bacterium]|nr:hypothetical protein [Bacteroidota bacterium]
MQQLAARLLLAVALLPACKQAVETSQNDGVLARVYDVSLSIDDLPSDVREKAKGNDSLSLLKVYVNNWVKQQVSLHKAKQNIGDEFPDIEAKVRDYRNSLIIYEYHRALFEQMLDTSVSEDEMLAYYEKNQKNFELKRNIVRLRYVKLPLEAENMAKARKWFLSEDASDRFKLLDYCAQHAVNTFLDEESWLSFDDLLKEIPLAHYDQERFLRSNKFVELKDNDFVYWLYIHDFRIKSGVSPFEFEQERIRNILINKRKLKLLEEVEGSLMKEAESENAIQWLVD